MTHYICIDIGGSAIKHALIDFTGTISQSDRQPTPETLETFLIAIKEIQKKYASFETAGIAISMPGLIDAKTGQAIHGGALSFIQELNVRHLLREHCGVPVQIENDGKCAALGEHWLGNLVGVENGIAIVIGTGIAGGIIINNQLLRGHHLTAGEFSYIRTNSNSDAFQDLFAIRGSSVILSKTYAAIKGVDEAQMDGKQFFADVVANLPEATKLLTNYAKHISVQLMNLQTILDPEVITIGGGISQQDALFTEINQHLDELVDNFPLPLMRPNLKQSSLGNKANLLGALKNFIDQANQNK